VAPPLRPNGALRYDAVRRGLQLANCKPRSILEIGCGVGALATKLAELGDYVGLEPDEASFELARARLDGSRAAEIRNARFEDLDQSERFDLVCAFEVLEHMENDVAELTAWTSRVAPNGLLMVSVPAYQRRFSAYDEYVGHYRRYEPAQLAALLREVGLEDVRVMNWGFPFSYAVEYANLRIVRRQLSKRAGHGSMHERTAASGRFRTVPDAVGSIATAFVWPFRFAQRRFPTRGPGLLAFGRMSGATTAT
jgi:SAM-dependent methyltransferase